ncbi:MAG: class I SAM-dependent methyltransferase [Rhodospirillales bacterium]|nr:class I SAM-dependent methyltransferase [Rhodospirillales bacterium]
MTAAVGRLDESLARDARAILRCPACGGEALAVGADALACSCGALYPFDRAARVCSLVAQSGDSAIKRDIRAWWGDLFRQIYAETDARLTPETLASALNDLEDLFRCREHLAAVEMPLGALAGRSVLEIGCGGGGHSALFARKGASIVATDITPERAGSAALKLSLLPGCDSRAYQADAENLPFRDDVFDIVYSNGALHHSEDTDHAVAEIRRVLKPGGRAVLMLYARHSAVFWFDIVPRGLFSGEIFRRPEAEWAGRVTEGTPKFGQTKNPITRVYSRRELRSLLKDFRIVSLRKSSFQFDNFAVPRLTQIRQAVLRFFGRRPHPGGTLVYGGPFFVETATELALGRHIGFAWNIVAEKP